ncbi:MAG: porin, partial [Undibacterium sp.]|nr:porin [Undibacterium sp.]
SSLNPDVGTAGVGTVSLFDRVATLGLSGSLGKLSLGRQLHLVFDAATRIEPMNFGHVSSNPYIQFGLMSNNAMYSLHGSSSDLTSAIRQNNSIKYTSPVMDQHWSVSAMVGLGEHAGNTKASAYTGASASYVGQELSTAVSYGQFTDATNSSKLTSYFAGARWTMNSDWVIKVLYSQNQVNTTKRKISIFGVGVDYLWMPRSTFTAVFYANRRAGDLSGSADQFVLMDKYELSKRSVIYVSLSHARAGTSLAKDTDLGLFMSVGNRSAHRALVGMSHAF